MTIPATLTLPTSPDLASAPGPFEGPEKLLEIWFAPSSEELDSYTSNHTAGSYASPSGSNNKPRTRSVNGAGDWRGLRKVPREVWEEMLDIVKCKVLSVVEGEQLDAYLLSESSLFVAPHLIILKTCGTTLNLLGLHRIIEIAREYCGFTNVWRCFYSRKSFFFPERQMGPHKDWRDEVNFLDGIFGTAGSAYTVGPMNRDHWLLYLTSPNTQPLLPVDTALDNASFRLSLPSPGQLTTSAYQDTTLEILMSHLEPAGRLPFFLSADDMSAQRTGHELGAALSSSLGIDQLFSPEETRLDSFGFEPCGYSANAVIGTGMPTPSAAGQRGGGYYTIHVTPEEGWSYASFECNVPLTSSTDQSLIPNQPPRPDLPTLIRNVVSIFQPNRLSITLFVSTSTDSNSEGQTSDVEQKAWSAFGTNILGKAYERKDRIGYEFDGYDLVFACFERKGWKEPKHQITI